MKREHLRKAFDTAKYRLASEELDTIAQSLKENTKEGRDWIFAKSLIKVFEEMAEERK